MDAKDICNLSEAYMEVYASPEELDEGKSSRPRYPGGRGVLDQERRDEKREASAENMRGHTAGPGTITKNPKKLRKQKALGELGEQVDIYDIILSHLLDEGYAETVEAAEVIMVNMSEDWRESIVDEMLDEGMTSYERNRQRAAQRAAARNAARAQGKTGVVPGVGYVSPRKERETWTDESGHQRHTSGARMPKKD